MTIILGWGLCALISVSVLLWIEFRMPPEEELTIGGAVKCTVVGVIRGPLYCFGFLIFVLLDFVRWISKRPLWNKPIIARRRTKEFYELQYIAEAHITPEKYKAGQWMD